MNMNNGVSNEYHYSHKMQSLVISLKAQADQGVWLSEKLTKCLFNGECERELRERADKRRIIMPDNKNNKESGRNKILE